MYVCPFYCTSPAYLICMLSEQLSGLFISVSVIACLSVGLST